MTPITSLPFKAEVKTFITLQDHEFDQFINKQYNVEDFSFAADQESGNGDDHSFNVKKEEIIWEWDLIKLKEFKTTGRQNYITDLLLRDLVNQDIIPEGRYLIQVSW